MESAVRRLYSVAGSHGDDPYAKGTRKYERVILERGPIAVSSRLFFVFAFSLRAFRGPDFLGAWNKLRRL